MSERDELSSLLREWEAPQPPSSLDAKVLEAYRNRAPESVWRRWWSMRISVPVPALAGLAVLLLFGWWFRSRQQTVVVPTQPVNVSIPRDGYLSRLEAAGFQPLMDGEARVIRAERKRP